MTQEAIETIDLTEEIDFARTVAREAATIAMTFYVGSSDVKYKSGNEPVTEADRSANNHIVKRVREVFPEDGILSEESKDDLSRLEKDRVWIIDPLDGTKEFIARNGEFSIMIGLAIGHEPVLGVIMQPETNLVYVGVKGVGAILEENGETHSAYRERHGPAPVR